MIIVSLIILVVSLAPAQRPGHSHHHDFPSAIVILFHSP